MADGSVWDCDKMGKVMDFMQLDSSAKNLEAFHLKTNAFSPRGGINDITEALKANRNLYPKKKISCFLFLCFRMDALCVKHHDHLRFSSHLHRDQSLCLPEGSIICSWICVEISLVSFLQPFGAWLEFASDFPHRKSLQWDCLIMVTRFLSRDIQC